MPEQIEDDGNELTTIQVKKSTSRKLAQLAQAYRRSKTEQVAFMVDMEAAKLSMYKLLPAAVEAQSVSENAA